VRAICAEPTDVAVFSSWDRIERAATAEPADLVLSTGRSRVSHDEWLADDSIARDWLDRGGQADPFPGHGDFRPDRFTAGLAVRYLETRRPRFLFVGLGEPDEYAHRGDYRAYVSSLRAADEALGALVAALERMGTRGARTSLLVTADHGRARDYRHHGHEFPESARVWLVAAGAGVPARGLVRARRPHHLADVAPTVRALLDLKRDDAASSGAPIGELLSPEEGPLASER
jgi:predicted AlkP superfamily pyrophosphatase or phosphodiesterase